MRERVGRGGRESEKDDHEGGSGEKGRERGRVGRRKRGVECWHFLASAPRLSPLGLSYLGFGP